jgi:hypothetical protein
VRISEEFVENELRSMDPRTFAVERLGIGDWPRVDAGRARRDQLRRLARRSPTPESAISGDVCFAFDVRPDRGKATIVACGYRSDGKLHVGGVDTACRDEVGCAAPRRAPRQTPPRRMIVRTAHGPVASLKTQLEDARLEVTEVSATEFAEACGRFADRGLDTVTMPERCRVAKTRPVGDAWAWFGNCRRLTSRRVGREDVADGRRVGVVAEAV